MAKLTLIGEPLADCEAAVHAAAARDLTEAIAQTAPRGFSARLLVAADREAPEFSNPRIAVERLPLRSTALPMVWRSGMSARPLDGEFVHAISPLIPLRGRGEDDGTQTSVLVPHALAWLAGEQMGKTTARQYRAFVNRAVKYADVIVTPTHATANALQEQYGDIAVQVIPLAPPSAYVQHDDAEQRRAALGLPPRYLVTTATAGETGRLEWILDALAGDPELPDLVVLTGDEEASANADGQDPSPDETRLAGAPDSVRPRVHVVRPRDLEDVGAALSGATLLAVPQQYIGAGYDLLAALASGVPAVHAGSAATAELVLDASVQTENREAFAAALSRLNRDEQERERLSVLAADRSRTFSWSATAALLWELHANI